jgi:hypothetical protein
LMNKLQEVLNNSRDGDIVNIQFVSFYEKQ